MNGMTQTSVSYVDAWLIDNRSDLNTEPLQTLDEILPMLNEAMQEQLGFDGAFEACGYQAGYDRETLKIQCRNLKVKYIGD